MKTLSEIKRNIISFYSGLQSKITDFSVGSVVNGIFYAISYILEDAYREINAVRQQAYVSTATGAYLDKIIYGTYQLERSPATRAVGYVVVYANSPVPSPEDIELKYAEYDYTTGEFLRGLQDATKFVGFNVQGEEGIVYSLINPRTDEDDTGVPYIIPTERLINLAGRNVQFLLLPVASVLKGSQVRVREGGIYSFPSPPPGLTGVINTSNPGSIFFSSSEAISGAPFFSRYTEISSYDNSTNSLRVTNAYNFSSRGFIEISRDENDSDLVASYTDGDVTREDGLILEYIDTTTTTITPKHPIVNVNEDLPTLIIVEDGAAKTLTLTEFTYNGTTYSGATLAQDIVDVLNDGTHPALIVQQRPDQISDEIIFDPDGVLTEDYKLIDSAIIGGAVDEDTDAQYRQALRAYLASLSKATNVALEAGTLQVPGVSFANTLPASLSPRGSATILASNDDGTLSVGQRSAIRNYLRNDWVAAGINVIVKAPELIKVNATISINLQTGVFKNSVTQQVKSTIEEYLKSTNPGGYLRYSDMLESVSDIGGVTNVFNLILTKELTDETYLTYKGEYNESVLAQATGNRPVNQNVLHSFTYPIDLGKAVDSSHNIVDETSDLAVGIVYSIVDGDNYELLEESSDVESLYNLYAELQNDAVRSADEFKNIIESYQNGTNATNYIATTEEEYFYFLSYVLGEYLEDSSDPDLYPINPNLIKYEDIRDYPASELEIFRMNNIILGTESTRLVGIKYV